MDRADIRNYRRWHRDAALRAKRAGFDLIYLYSHAGSSLLGDFLSRKRNRRSDEYGGSLGNRMRLLREVLQDTHEAVGDTCAVALRYVVDEGLSEDGAANMDESRAVIEALAEVPDLWDVNIREWRRDSMPSRFGPEGSQEEFIGFVKKLTTKPVVGVGRFTSPDLMVRQVKSGILDLIGAARPSIADPFLPNKIRDGELHKIRECIGCNMCVSGDMTMSPIRCTQNPSMGEEWRRGWHPEFIRPRESDKRVLVVGAGPAGLEASRALGVRGYDVTLMEASRDLGGRVAKEARLPGLAAWIRVLDYRAQALGDLKNVEVYRQNPVTAEDVVEYGFEHVAVAAGAIARACSPLYGLAGDCG